MQKFHVALQVENLFLQVVGIGVELLTAGHRNGVLQLCASHLDDILELLGLVAESADQSCERGHQTLVHADKGQTDGRGIDVVGRLSAVAMVVGVAILVVALLMAHDLKGTVGNHLVGVHVDRRSGTALHHVDGEMVMELSVDDLAASL